MSSNLRVERLVGRRTIEQRLYRTTTGQERDTSKMIVAAAASNVLRPEGSGRCAAEIIGD